MEKNQFEKVTKVEKNQFGKSDQGLVCTNEEVQLEGKLQVNGRHSYLLCGITIKFKYQMDFPN